MRRATRTAALAVLLLPLVNAAQGRFLAFPPLLAKALERCAEGAHARLVAGLMNAPKAGRRDHGVFADVSIAIPLRSPLVVRHDAKGDRADGDKNLLNPSALVGRSGSGSHCLVYALGIGPDSSFEQRMAKLGCEVHAFDCTVPRWAPHVVDKGFVFHEWCIGTPPPRDHGVATAGAYSQHTSAYTHENVKPLATVMHLLNHTRAVELLKFDIEGFEWALFNDQILRLAPALRPLELSFELHTENSNPVAVPQALVHGKGWKQVDELFLRLIRAGYRTLTKEVNTVDAACCEFVMLYVPDLSVRSQASSFDERPSVPRRVRSVGADDGLMITSHALRPGASPWIMGAAEHTHLRALSVQALGESGKQSDIAASSPRNTTALQVAQAAVVRRWPLRRMTGVDASREGSMYGSGDEVEERQDGEWGRKRHGGESIAAAPRRPRYR
eukprot:CAMPEP_0185206994 /NCGR_PEP_ID=MMETSP1140-20130426/59487_1 /TAXON_ID=298111 /ORGANISM="Pavlova sp., Strain CCMP459" /LENGTH=442 /DNA_ID=CAMNT_0027774667 /DNA_START=133 /DNA_END=1457 /DNA_ORIENTATION=+